MDQHNFKYTATAPRRLPALSVLLPPLLSGTVPPPVASRLALPTPAGPPQPPPVPAAAAPAVPPEATARSGINIHPGRSIFIQPQPKHMNGQCLHRQSAPSCLQLFQRIHLSLLRRCYIQLLLLQLKIVVLCLSAVVRAYRGSTLSGMRGTGFPLRACKLPHGSTHLHSLSHTHASADHTRTKHKIHTFTIHEASLNRRWHIIQH